MKKANLKEKLIHFFKKIFWSVLIFFFGLLAKGLIRERSITILGEIFNMFTNRSITILGEIRNMFTNMSITRLVGIRKLFAKRSIIFIISQYVFVPFGGPQSYF